MGGSQPRLNRGSNRERALSENGTSPGLPTPPEETMRRPASPIGTAGALTTRHNAWARQMRRPRQEGSSSIEPEAEAKRAARGSLRKSTREASSNLAGGRKIRCAIYTRKSSEEGLEQEFNSLDAQREACEAFVRSQKHEGWSILPQLYDDPGYSGGTMERPALKRLLADIAAHREARWIRTRDISSRTGLGHSPRRPYRAF
jgi:Resolvase, N terminal domain